MGDLFSPSSSHDAGARPIPWPPGITARAIYGGPNDCYRYQLEIGGHGAQADARLPTVMFLLMNPSTASEQWGDRTMLRAINFARSWGYDTILIGNTAAYRATDQGSLADVADPFGPDNDRHLLAMAERASLIVAAYGKPRASCMREAGRRAAHLLTGVGHNLHAIAVSNCGTPKHILYLKGDLQPLPWEAFADAN